jgi:hypothetical protein
VSRARTAIHSAAARVLPDIKADLRGTCACARPTPPPPLRSTSVLLVFGI